MFVELKMQTCNSQSKTTLKAADMRPESLTLSPDRKSGFFSRFLKVELISILEAPIYRVSITLSSDVN